MQARTKDLVTNADKEIVILYEGEDIFADEPITARKNGFTFILNVRINRIFRFFYCIGKYNFPIQ